VRDYIGDIHNMTVFDLFSGTGTIAQVLAPVAKQVIGVEIVEEAVEAAKENAEHNGLSNCRFIAGDVFKVLDEIEEKPDVIVLDPPRDGIHPKALPKILDYGVDKIVYISCKVTSLARDLEMIQARGYQVEKCTAVDQFCQTVHVESIVLLSKLHTNKHIEVELQMDELDLTAAESKATYAEIKDYVLKQSGLKVSNLYIAQVKQKCGIIERANYNLPKSENSRQPKCPPEKEAAIRAALEHFRMI
jgi:23S rRNA (uracil1939-C5)-methyltransferase